MLARLAMTGSVANANVSLKEKKIEEQMHVNSLQSYSRNKINVLFEITKVKKKSWNKYDNTIIQLFLGF